MSNLLKNLKLSYSVGGILFFFCPVCQNSVVAFHARFDTHVPYCKECNQEYKLEVHKVERKENNVR